LQNKIITIGLAPAWDKTIEIAGIDWNEHKTVSSQSITPAGKALNINKALSWMGEQSIAAGLWGSEDFAQMQEALKKFKGVKTKFTKVPGRTRENITVVDTKNSRQIHLRSKSTLANAKSIKTLKRDLQKMITEDTFVVFAGAMPKGAIELVEFAKRKGANVAVDTSGDALKKVVAKGGLFLIKPNVEELSELAGRNVKNDQKDIIAACKKLLTKVKMILVSRGDKGATLLVSPAITMAGSVLAISVKYTGRKYDVCNTVACGDYLLAGFISALAGKNGGKNGTGSLTAAKAEAKCLSRFFPNEQLCASALSSAIKSATAKAFGLNNKLSWAEVKLLKTYIEVQK
jgi:1-phosphofructokinase family hexose kinase